MNRPALQLTPSPAARQIAKRRVKCDERCQFARGPICECKCQGAHHGEAWQDTATLDLFTTEGKL